MCSGNDNPIDYKFFFGNRTNLDNNVREMKLLLEDLNIQTYSARPSGIFTQPSEAGLFLSYVYFWLNHYSSKWYLNVIVLLAGLVGKTKTFIGVVSICYI